MSGSVEVRQFLLRHDGVDASTSGGVPAPESGSAETSRISDDQIRRARIAVASGSMDAADCATLLDMLGLTPDSDGIPPAQR